MPKFAPLRSLRASWEPSAFESLRRHGAALRRRATRPPSHRWRRNAFLQLLGESLEPRRLLESQGLATYDSVSAEWFAAAPTAAKSQSSGQIVGPLAVTVGSGVGDWQASADVADWIVRLTPAATAQSSTVVGTRRLLNDEAITFQVERGLGLPGQVVVRAAATTEQVRASLAHNPNVAQFEPNSFVLSQQLPNDPDFPSLTGLHNVGQFGGTADADIDAPEAWDETTGSTNVVVGVIDSGIDVTHPDLYLNIWINQGEIPTALRGQLSDPDADGRITFYDLNAAANSAFVQDLNHNSYIDAEDLLADPHWADGVDTDHNSFVDDFFGWNFRSTADEPFAPNDPQDVLGHGTHVAGTIGAIGNNGRGVTGINWRSSLMALKFLDDANSGQTSDAVAAVNYATMMRHDQGENVRVLNASWGQSGSESPALRTAIEAAGASDILFVAAAGNGNILGQGINLDREPFYPASSNLPNVISVAASGPNDELARFSNFGATTVDLVAPGIGILSTLPGGRYGTANGTSMAAPHVAGTAALVLSLIPDASQAELLASIRGTVAPLTDPTGTTVTGGRLNAKSALGSAAFAPRATLVSAANITSAGGTDNLITVRYLDRQGINPATVGNADIMVTRQWGPHDTLPTTLVPGSVEVTSNGQVVTATYRVAAPGGSWDALDFGTYAVSVAERQVANLNALTVSTNAIGEFSVRIADSSIFYVDTFADVIDANVGDGTCAAADGSCTLRAAIQEANAAAPSARTIILEDGDYRLSIAPVTDSQVSFSIPSDASGCVGQGYAPEWSNEESGDLDVLGNITFLGNDVASSSIDAAGLDRVFRVYSGASLTLRRVNVTGGVAPPNQEGGGILSAGNLQLDNASVSGNRATVGLHGLGGGIAVWSGTTSVVQTTISDNRANGGGGLFVCNQADLSVSQSLIARNVAENSVATNVDGFGKYPSGGGLLTARASDVQVSNSTFSGNSVMGLNHVIPGTTIDDIHSFGGAVRRVDTCSLETCQGTPPPQTVVLESVTVAENSSFSAISGDLEETSYVNRSIVIHNSLFARNEGTYDLGKSVLSNDHNLYATFFSIGIAGQISLGNDLVVSSADWLGPLQDNGGPTLTHLLGAGSPAIDAADTESFTAVDQRSILRPQLGVRGLFGDIGAVEASDALLRGVVFKDLDGNGKRDRNELGIIGATVYLDLNQNRQVDDGEPIALTQPENPNTIIAEQGTFTFPSLAPQSYTVVPQVEAGWSRAAATAGLELVSVSNSGEAANGINGSFSSDGRFVAYSSTSSNLVPNDTNGANDVFVYDRQNLTVERVSVAANGQQGNSDSVSPSISADGRFVAFASGAGNLVPGDTNGFYDVFVYDRHTRTLERVSVANDATEGLDSSYAPSISADGRFVAFQSSASNLVPSDTNASLDIFVYDRRNRTIDRVSLASDGDEANDHSYAPSISADGRFVAFSSLAANLVSGDLNGSPDVFVYDIQNQTVERNGDSGISPSISANGQVVVFISNDELFLHDRQTQETTKLDDNGGTGRTYDSTPSVSADGRFIAVLRGISTPPPFSSYEQDVFVFDRLGVAMSVAKNIGRPAFLNGVTISPDGRFMGYSPIGQGVIVVPNPLLPPSAVSTVSLYASQVFSRLEFGLVPDPGVIQGTCFQDVLANGVYDLGETIRAGCKVYLDANGNGQFDVGESFQVTGTDGQYSFTNLPAEGAYRVAVVVPDGYTLVLPNPTEHGVWNVYLPAGGTISDRDFGLRPTNTIGQFENATVSGQLFEDRDNNGVRNGAEPGLAGIQVFLDLLDDGVRQFNEPRTTTDANGNYSFSGLGNRPYTVRVLDMPRYQETSPLGNHFEPTEYSLAVAGSPLGSPQDVTVGDFNSDMWPDLAVAVYDRNSVSILLNDQHGGFAAPINIALNPLGIGPVALLAGNFDGQGGADLAVVNSLSSKVTILRNFSGQTFAGVTNVAVGVLPNGLASGDLDGDLDLDLIVTHDVITGGATRTLDILRNDGQGVFAADAAPPVTGNNPAGVVTGFFNGDTRLDFAVADFGTNPRGADLGDVRVFLANGAGGYTASVACAVGFGPSAVTTGDLDGDGQLDLAVANFLSDNLTVCKGLGDGTFQAVATLAGGSGPMDITAQDIDGDHDLDLLVTNGKSKKVGILRNDSTPGQFHFQPAESFGAANFPGATRISLAAADLDHNGTLDLAVANSQENRVLVNWNTLVGGAHRVALTGVETVSGLNFGFVPVNATPTLDAIPNPAAMNEDANPLTVTLSGITAGVGDDQPLRVEASSNNSALIASLPVQYTSANATGNMQVTLVPDQSGTAIILVTVTDGGLDGDLATPTDNGSTTRSFTVTVNPLNDPPTLNSLPAAYLLDRNVTTQAISLDGINSGGGESQPLSVTATTTNATWIQNLSLPYSAGSATATMSFTTSGSVGEGSIMVTVTDGGLDNNLSTMGDNLSISRTIVIVASNGPPSVALANGTTAVPEDTNLSLRRKIADVVVTDDGVGGQTLSLTGSDSQQFEIDNGQLYLRAGTVLNFEDKPQLAVTVNVDDPTVGVSPDSSANLTVTITNVNEPPSVALANTVTSLPENTDLAARRKVADIQISDDALGTRDLTLNGADAGRFEIANGNELYLRAGTVLNFESQNRYVVQVDVDDATLGSSPDGTVPLTLQVTDVNEPPSVTLTNVSAPLAENTDLTTRRRVADVVVAEDGLGRPEVSLSGSDAPLFEIVSGSLYLRAGTALNFEAKSQLEVAVNVDDPTVGVSPDSSANLTVTVTNVNEPPSVALANTLTSLPENTDLAARRKVADIQISDDTLGTRVLSLNGADASHFEIVNGNELYLRAGTILNFESQNRYVVQVDVDDATLGSSPDGTVTLTLQVTDVNEPPSVTLTNVTASLAENNDLTTRRRVADVVVAEDGLGRPEVSLSGSDAPLFEIVSGSLYLRAGTALNFEDKSQLAVTVNVDDTTVGATPDSSAQLTVTITNVNEPPSVALANTLTSLPENTDLAARRKVADIQISDDALGTRDLTLNGTDAGRFEIANGNELYLRAGTVLNFESQNRYVVQVDVDDVTLGSSPDGTVTLTLQVTDVNEPPTVTLANTVSSLPENTTVANRRKLADLQVADDALGRPEVTLSGPDADQFEVIGGELFLRRGANLDFERLSQGHLTLAVNIDDPQVGSSPDETKSFTLTVTDVNEPPSLALLNPVNALAENRDATAAVTVATIRVSDDALGTAALRLSGPDASQFVIDQHQLQLRSGVELDFETQSRYAVTVVVDDPLLGTDVDGTTDYQLSVTDVNEAPSDFFLSNGRIQEDTDTSSGPILIANVIVLDLDRSSGTYGYALVDGAGADENSLFQLNGRSLLLRQGVTLDATNRPSYSVRLRVTDAPHELDRTFAITVTDVNTPPTDIQLFPAVVQENLDTSAEPVVIGSLVAADDNPPNRHAFSFVTGSGDTDNYRFSLAGAVLSLRQGVAVDYERQSAYQIRLAVSDGVNRIERALTVSVRDVNEPPENRLPVAGNDDGGSTDEDTLLSGTAPGLLRNDTDEDAGDTLTVSRFDTASRLGAAVTVAADGAWTYDPSQVTEFQVLSARQSLTDDFTYTVDDGHGGTSSATVTITVRGVNDWVNARDADDVNHDGVVTSIDALVIINEINTNGTRGLPGRVGAPSKSYDANGDNNLSPADALKVINRLNAAQGEGVTRAPVRFSPTVDWGAFAASWEANSRDDSESDWLDLLAADETRSS